MTNALSADGVLVLGGDCRALIRALSDGLVDAIVTDPPYELGFMGKGWDSTGVAYSVPLWSEALRVLKPGGHLLAFGGTRTWHRLACAIEDAGFELRDSIAWLYGTGTPKSKAQLKPAHEPIVVARKPAAGPWLNIDACRIEHADAADLAASQARNPGRSDVVTSDVYGGDRPQQRVNDAGRWPANVVLDETTADELGEVARYFYCAKASTKERPRVDGVTHPTVKPLTLMRWLVRLVTPPDGLVLDPFAGSGTTLQAARAEGFRALGFELEPTYQPLIAARLGLTLDGAA